MKKFALLLAFVLTSCTSTQSPTSTTKSIGYDSQLSTFEYPFPVHVHNFKAQDQSLQMAYMDIKPEKANGKTVVMFHGKNFSGFYFEPIIKELTQKGFRVIVPDQIGFGKSTKPQSFQYSFHALAKYTDDLLTSLNVNEFTLVGHSMGGMLATRYALMFDKKVKKLVLVNPIGLEDYKTLTGFKSFDEMYLSELKANEHSIREYQRVFYYDNNWKAEYEPMIKAAVGWTVGPDHALVSLNAAKTSELIYTQPVYYEFKLLKMPTALINGQRDKTAPGKPWAPEENKAKMGNYPKLGRDVIKMISKGKLIELKGLGHMPFVEDFDGFMKVFVPEL